MLALVILVHVSAGLTAVICGATAMLSPKRRGRHPRAGTYFLLALLVVFTTAVAIAAARPHTAYLLLIGAVALSAAGLGYAARRIRWRGWLPFHITGMATAYIAMLSAFYIDNGPRLPLWNLLPPTTFWFLPAAFGLPLLLRALRRHTTRMTHHLQGDNMTSTPGTTHQNGEPVDLREQVRYHYAAAARAVGDASATSCRDDSGGCSTPIDLDESPFGAGQYSDTERDALPSDAVTASLGCGNPLAVADLHEGDTVLDLGSGGGIDVLLSARRIGPTGTAYGLDMTDEMLDLARRNADEAGVANVEFLKGDIEDIPLPDASVDTVISNCVINLSTDKPAVFAETFRVLRPGGRFGVSDVVAEDHLTTADRAERGNHVGCVAGCLTIGEYRDQLTAAGFTHVEVTPTHQVADGVHAAIVRATKPTDGTDSSSAN